MKGILFNLLEQYVLDRSGDDDAWDDILDACSLQTKKPLSIVGPGTYSDADFLEIVDKAGQFFSMSAQDLLFSFGGYALPVLAKRYPHFFSSFRSPKSFLKQADLIHQVEVKKLYKDSSPPHFKCKEAENGALILTYTSRRQMGELVKGLLEGLGNYYQESIHIEELSCEKMHDPFCCKFLLTFEKRRDP